MNSETPYAVKGQSLTEQAEPSSANRAGGTIAMRTLVELQVISYLLHQMSECQEDLTQLRQNFSDSIT